MTSILVRLSPLLLLAVYLAMPAISSALEEHIENDRQLCQGGCGGMRPFHGDLGGIKPR